MIFSVSERRCYVLFRAASGGVERDLRLVPIEDRRRQGELREGFTLGQYPMLVDYTSRVVRDGKTTLFDHVLHHVIHAWEELCSPSQVLDLVDVQLLG